MSIEYNLYLRGDLNQMFLQKDYFTRTGLNIEQDGFSFTVNKDNVMHFLTTMFHNEIEGWWVYHKELIKYNICTKEEYKNKLNNT